MCCDIIRSETAVYIEYLRKALGHDKWGPNLFPADVAWRPKRAARSTAYSLQTAGIAEDFDILHESIAEQAVVRSVKLLF